MTPCLDMVSIVFFYQRVPLLPGICVISQYVHKKSCRKLQTMARRAVFQTPHPFFSTLVHPLQRASLLDTGEPHCGVSVMQVSMLWPHRTWLMLRYYFDKKQEDTERVRERNSNKTRKVNLPAELTKWERCYVRLFREWMLKWKKWGHIKISYI